MMSLLLFSRDCRFRVPPARGRRLRLRLSPEVGRVRQGQVGMPAGLEGAQRPAQSGQSGRNRTIVQTNYRGD